MEGKDGLISAIPLITAAERKALKSLVRDIAAKDEVIAFLYQIETRYDVPLSPVIYTVAEYETNRRMGSRFVENVEKEGVVLYDAQRAGKE